MAVKILSAEQAVDLIQDEAHLVLGGFIGSVVPEALEKALKERYLKTQSPKDLSLYFAAGQGDAKDRSVNHLAQEGLIKFALGGHWGLVPALQKLAVSNKIQGYNLPQGVIAHLYRDSAAKKPGVITTVGLHTFVDPRIEGGKINDITKEDWVEVITLKGKEYLFYKTIPANVAFIRGTTADKNGNITMEEECLYAENLAMAQMVKNNNGLVIAQVKKVVENGDLNPQLVAVPGILVDVVVICENETDHMQTFAEQYNPRYCNSPKMLGLDKNEDSKEIKIIPLDYKKVIARRCALELEKDVILNLGIGVPEYISQIAVEEGISENFTLTVEPGAIGGNPVGGLSFGASDLPHAIVTQDQQFDFYDGGGLDQAFLGLAQCDQDGNVNVSRFGTRIAGCGGFINITQNAKKVYFCGSFMAGKQEITAGDGKLNIVKDGDIVKFINKVQQITFSGDYSNQQGKEVLYITERAVFKLNKDGFCLIEIAPGVDLEKDILEKMEFKPKVAADLKVMDERIFYPEKMNLIK